MFPNRSCLIAVTLFCAMAADGPAQTAASTASDATPTGGYYRIGRGVTPPRVTYQASPEYSDEARAAGLEGTCILALVVGADGKPRKIVVKRSLGLGLDEKAIEALQNFRFKPGHMMNEGRQKPVAVMVRAEITFRLSGKNEASISMPDGPL